MSTNLYWQTLGQGPDLVLLHGWGMNGAVWQQTVESLKQDFTVHIVDLPGYGHSAQYHAADLAQIAEMLLVQAPEQAVWLGWSLGGLIATYIAEQAPERVSKLITVASSPKFSADSSWRGIQPQILSAFTEQLLEDFSLTIERFMALQAMGSPSARQDVKQLKQAILSRPQPNPDSLLVGLNILADVDLREVLSKLSMPVLRLYGRLDGLVPIKVASALNTQLPHTQQFIFSRSSHAPFMTEQNEFCEQIRQFAG
ncbi:pimeloyl-[acyl-carrier protein] methyl ester esterase [Vibrio azureus]|uniref:Pimeloyl-[acyl-carrier protein] methyl ester esterase n=1 Tax=Vibrio azureus NBRC 104587 TaxID=1219077 RepID=U3AQX6_9VIBR|nr:pimeloyl-ACP methyl ester esterase BioH [Vibrio azureus]AUI85045.1 pimeloyl-[acyl-carrier protein] methyl ester esterase [Vibrio azureus]GAD75682.1 pimelyl-[acyl-carrier protein] methyl ester esterase [Vibrio azureus NBRC 104587]